MEPTKKDIDIMMCGVCLKLSQMECETDYIKILLQTTLLKDVMTLIIDEEEDETLEMLVSSEKMLELFSVVDIQKFRTLLYLLYPLSDNVCFIKILDKTVELVKASQNIHLSGFK